MFKGLLRSREASWFRIPSRCDRSRALEGMGVSKGAGPQQLQQRSIAAPGRVLPRILWPLWLLSAILQGLSLCQHGTKIRWRYDGVSLGYSWTLNVSSSFSDQQALLLHMKNNCTAIAEQVFSGIVGIDSVHVMGRTIHVLASSALYWDSSLLHHRDDLSLCRW